MPGWGRNGGLDRLRYPHFAHRKRMIRIPVPRRLPADVVPAGGAQVKVLAREHAQAVVDVATGPSRPRAGSGGGAGSPTRPSSGPS